MLRKKSRCQNLISGVCTADLASGLKCTPQKPRKYVMFLLRLPENGDLGTSLQDAVSAIGGARNVPRETGAGAGGRRSRLLPCLLLSVYLPGN